MRSGPGNGSTAASTGSWASIGSAGTRKAPDRLEAVRREDENSIEARVGAVTATAATGEIGALFRKVHGEDKGPGL